MNEEGKKVGKETRGAKRSRADSEEEFVLPDEDNDPELELDDEEFRRDNEARKPSKRTKTGRYVVSEAKEHYNRIMKRFQGLGGGVHQRNPAESNVRSFDLITVF